MPRLPRRIGEHYFIHTDLWLSAVGSIYGMLCVDCLEKRLGRQLTHEDFPTNIVNSPKYEKKSQKLMNRLKIK